MLPEGQEARVAGKMRSVGKELGGAGGKKRVKDGVW